LPKNVKVKTRNILQVVLIISLTNLWSTRTKTSFSTATHFLCFIPAFAQHCCRLHHTPAVIRWLRAVEGRICWEVSQTIK